MASGEGFEPSCPKDSNLAGYRHTELGDPDKQKIFAPT